MQHTRDTTCFQRQLQRQLTTGFVYAACTESKAPRSRGVVSLRVCFVLGRIHMARQVLVSGSALDKDDSAKGGKTRNIWIPVLQHAALSAAGSV
uniref:Uncharacterized protein n=1 Tax=Anopheles dirus TaxID=7168 RepID=A0A182NYT9_9DIPT